MSLGIYITGQIQQIECICHRCNNKHTREDTEYFYSDNIANNLGEMAIKADIYNYLWHPENLNITQAQDLIKPLEHGLQSLLKNPAYFKQFNPQNGWGSYESLVKSIRSYVLACKEWPESNIHTST